MGLGIGHYIPLVVYLGFWVMCVLALTGRPLPGLYYMIPFLPYRTLREHLIEFPLGGNLLTFLVLSVIVGAVIKGKKLPKTKMYVIWFGFGIYLYLSMWLGMGLGNAPMPLWLSDINFVTWKDYMLIPLIFVAAGMGIEDRKTIRTGILVTAFAVLLIDRSFLLETLSHSWTNFDENKRTPGPLGFGSNQTAAYLAQFSMFFWGMAVFIKRRKAKLLTYGLVALTLFAVMYAFSRGAYLAVLVSLFFLAIFKDRKLLIVGGVFLLTWQVVVPTAVTQRVNMTHNANGQLETSAEERVKLWEDSKAMIASDPIFGIGYASYQLTAHVDGLRDTHNWYVKVLVETGLIGFVIVLALLYQMLKLTFRLFRRAKDPLYQGLGLGLFLAIWACIVANMFGDRWTYIEITGPLWVLIGGAARALQLTEAATPEAEEIAGEEAAVPMLPYAAYR